MDWDNNGGKDLLVGAGVGGVYIYQNIGTNSDNTPILDNGTLILNKTQTGERATPVMMDWDGDEDQDILVGNLAGKIQVFKNDGFNNFTLFSNLQVGGVDFDLTTGNDRSAPRIYDWNGDGMNDILVGEVYGYLYYLENVGTNAAPVFNSSQKLLLSDGTALRYLTDPVNPHAAPRSRLDITDWNGDGIPDMLVGGQDGRVMLFTAAAPEPMSTTLFIVGGGVLGLRRLRKKFRGRNK